MKTIQISDATEIQLDWLVAKIEGLSLWMRHDWLMHLSKLPGAVSDSLAFYLQEQPNEPIYVLGRVTRYLPRYTLDWEFGGPIIDRKKIQSGYINTFKEWECRMRGGNRAVGSTLLIAAMRCYIISAQGDTAEVPEELK